MRIRLLLLVPLALCLLAASAMGGDYPYEYDKKASPKSADGLIPAKDIFVKGYMEGFEGAFPPAGWTHTVTNGAFTWTTDTFSPYEGFTNAKCPWQAGVPQDERLSFQHFIDSNIDEDHLVFATSGNTFWATNANFTVEVNGMEVWNFLLDWTAAAFVWDLASIDLTAWDQQLVTIEFIYAGDDGADQLLDAVQVNEGYTPPPPPSNDDCTGVIDLQEQSLIQFSVDLCLASNSFSAGEFGNLCTGYTTSGSDVVYSIYLQAGESFMATENGTHDMAMYLVRDCDDTVGTCVAGSDNCCSGAEEVVSWVADVEGWYYLIVDGYSSCSVVTVTIMQPVGADSVNWGAVKAAYE